MSDERFQQHRPDPLQPDIRAGRPADREPGGDYADDEPRDRPRMGSLAQSARNKHLREARLTLLIVGIIMAIAHGAMYFVERGQIPDLLRQEANKRGMVVVDAAEFSRAVATVQTLLLLIHGGAILVAISFIVLSFFVVKYPVPIVSVALGLYILLNLIFVVIDPANLVRGLIIKVIVIVALIKALQAGIAAQKEARPAYEGGYGD